MNREQKIAKLEECNTIKEIEDFCIDADIDFYETTELMNEDSVIDYLADEFRTHPMEVYEVVKASVEQGGGFYSESNDYQRVIERSAAYAFYIPYMNYDKECVEEVKQMIKEKIA